MSILESDRLYKIIKNFTNQQPEIQGMALISSEGELLASSIGLDEGIATILAGNMLYVARQMQDELLWQELQQVTLRGNEGNLRLANCGNDTFLLIKTANIAMASLERDIRQVIKILQADQSEAITEPFLQKNIQPKASTKAPSNSLISTQLDPEFISECQQVLTEFIGPIAPTICQRILSQNHRLSAGSFVELLSEQIPNHQQGLEFQRRLRFREDSDIL